MKIIQVLVLGFLLGAGAAHAAFWTCKLPGGTYMVSLPTVASVSTHEYFVDGAVRVTELTIATTSSVVARFYYLEPTVTKAPLGIGQSVIDKVQEHIQDGVQRTGIEPVWQKVVKSYPTSTHMHTVEYRLDSLDQIKKIQNSIMPAWRNNQETTLTIDQSSNNANN